MEAVFTTELLAIIWLLWWTEDIKPNKSHMCFFLICSDSEAALMALRGGKSNARPDLINKILSVLFIIGRTGCEVMFCWVPGHAGVEGNEIADYSKGNPKERRSRCKSPWDECNLEEKSWRVLKKNGRD